METLEARQSELQDKSRAVRAARNRKNASGPRKGKKPPRVRKSARSLLRDIAQGSYVAGRDRLEAAKILLWMEKKITFEQLAQLSIKKLVEEKNDEPRSEPAPDKPTGADLMPARKL